MFLCWGSGGERQYSKTRRRSQVGERSTVVNANSIAVG